MGKHVCPVCEDVYAVQATVGVRQGERADAAQGWACPGCGYTFVDVKDLERLLRWTVEPYEPGSTSVTGQVPPQAPVVRRRDALATSSSQ